MHTPLPLLELAVICFCLAIGGVIKGATGAGAPLLAVPALAAFYDVRFAIVIMTVPNLVTNLLQAWKTRGSAMPSNYLLRLLLGAGIGVALGTAVLRGLEVRFLSLLVALVITFYLAVRLVRSAWRLDMARASKLAAPVGLASGFIQGASGLSAPVSLSYLNAMQLDRLVFINTVSLLFVTLGVVQMPALALAGILTPMGVALSALAVIPMLAAMPLGNVLARHVSRQAFDRLVMALLGLLAIRMFWEAINP